MRGIELSGIVTDPERVTTCKTRIMAEGSYVFAHHLARVDRIDREPLSQAIDQGETNGLADGTTAVIDIDAGRQALDPGRKLIRRSGIG